MSFASLCTAIIDNTDGWEETFVDEFDGYTEEERVKVRLLMARTNAVASAVFSGIAGDLTFVKELPHTITIADTVTSATAGGALTIEAAAGITTGAGGAIALTGGAGGNDAVGGAATVTGGAAGGGNRAGGVGYVTGGAGAGTAAGGATRVLSGTGGATGAGGTATVSGGSGGATSGAGGAVTITGGSAAAGNSAGGNATFGAGNGTGTGNGGSTTVAGGTSGTGATGNGGGVDITGGEVDSTDGNGGNITITPTAAAGTGRGGRVILRSFPLIKSTATAMTDTATIGVDGILGGLIAGTPTAAANYTMPTGTVLDAAFPSTAAAGDSIEFAICNLATDDSYDITLLTAASGITLKFSNVLVEANSATTKINWGRFRCVRTGANAFDVYRVG
jgi:hypothetical protein